MVAAAGNRDADGFDGFDEHWNRLCAKTRQLSGDGGTKMTIAIDGFKKALRLAFENGVLHGVQSQKDAERAAKDFGKFGNGKASEDFGDILGGMFGGRN